MLALGDKLFENKTLMFAAAAIALFVAAVLLLWMFRLAFGRRLRLPGNGRGRLPRLGIVDAFDLDRQRQLVIVRRDNVEHLIMIGGPNDLVIESQIVRAEAREGRLRDKEQKEPGQAPSGPVWPPEIDAALRPGPAAPPPLRKPQVAPTNAPEPSPEPFPVSAFDAPLTTSAPNVAPSPRQPVFPMPPRRPPPQFTPPAQRPPLQREPLVARSEPLPPRERSEAGARPAGGFPRAPLATPFLRPSQHSGQEPAVKAAFANAAAEATPAPRPATAPTPPSASVEPANEAAPTVDVRVEADAEAPASLQAASAVAPAPTEAVPAPASVSDPLDSIEEEMAKLLGRSSGT